MNPHKKWPPWITVDVRPHPSSACRLCAGPRAAHRPVIATAGHLCALWRFRSAEPHPVGCSEGCWPTQARTLQEEAGQLGLGDVRGVFYNDLSDEAAAQAIQNSRPQSISSLTSPSPRPAWQDKGFHGKLAYIVCTDDAWMPPSVQRGIVDGSGVEWTVRELPGGHCAFLSSPKQLADIVSELSHKFHT